MLQCGVEREDRDGARGAKHGQPASSPRSSQKYGDFKCDPFRML